MHVGTILKIMKAFLWMLLFIFNIIFVKSTDAKRRGDKVPLDDDEERDLTGKKRWPEQSFSSSESHTKDEKSKHKDPFWEHPIVHKLPWIYSEHDHDLGESRYPFYDASYPQWIPGWRNPKEKKYRHYKVHFDSASDDDNNVYSGNEPLSDDSFERGPPIKARLNKAKINAEENDSNKMTEAEKKQYRAEIKAADMTQLLGINQHYYQPDNYRIYDLGRRFVPQYPYEEVNQNHIVQEDEDSSLIPIRAPPEVVLAIANKSALIQAAQPVDPNEHLLKKESLRTGKFWNAYWKEEVEDPSNMLRSHKSNKLDTINAKLSPGTPIYEYVSKLNKLYPKLLYVINKTT